MGDDGNCAAASGAAAAGGGVYPNMEDIAWKVVSPGEGGTLDKGAGKWVSGQRRCRGEGYRCTSCPPTQHCQCPTSSDSGEDDDKADKEKRVDFGTAGHCVESLNSIAGLALRDTDGEQDDDVERDILYDQKTFTVRSVTRKKEELQVPEEEAAKSVAAAQPSKSQQVSESPKGEPSPRKRRRDRKRDKKKRQKAKEGQMPGSWHPVQPAAVDMAARVRLQNDNNNFGNRQNDVDNFGNYAAQDMGQAAQSSSKDESGARPEWTPRLSRRKKKTEQKLREREEKRKRAEEELEEWRKRQENKRWQPVGASDHPRGRRVVIELSSDSEDDDNDRSRIRFLTGPSHRLSRSDVLALYANGEKPPARRTARPIRSYDDIDSSPESYVRRVEEAKALQIPEGRKVYLAKPPAGNGWTDATWVTVRTANHGFCKKIDCDCKTNYLQQ